jgi:hypothetical protein
MKTLNREIIKILIIACGAAALSWICDHVALYEIGKAL